MKTIFILLTSLAGALFAQPQFLDSTFDADGMVITPIATSATLEMCFSVAVHSNGKIIAGGDTRTGNTYALALYNADGSLDNNFGTGGKVTTAIGGFSSAGVVGFQSDGKILAGGTSLGTALTFCLVRYLVNGTLDAGFGAGGIAATAFPGGSRSMAIQADGKIILAGGSSNNFGLVRFDTNGVLDNTFGTGGTLTTSFGVTSSPFHVSVRADGKITVVGAGTIGVGAGAFSTALAARYDSFGNLDVTFGTAGKLTVSTNMMFTPSTAAIQTDGKIVVGGEAPPNPYNFAIARFDSTGTLDNAFGTLGVDTTDILGRSRDHVSSLAIQPDGKIVVAGYAGQVTTSPLLSFALVRYLANGSLDLGFGNGGKIFTDFGGGNNTISSIALQTDGNIVAGGGFSSGSPGFTLARYSSASTGIHGFSHARLLKSMRLIQANGRKTFSAMGKTNIKIVK